MDFSTAAAAVAKGADPVALAAELLASLDEEERLGLLDGDIPFWAGLADIAHHGYHRRPFPAAQVPRVGIPGFFFSDGPRGIVVDHATCFPVSMARGATFDPTLEERVGDVIGRELRAVGATLYGGVCVNLLRHPGWGRAQETYGEDPLHVGLMGAGLVRGVQRHAMATVKHFAANSMENMRFQVDVTIDEAVLHEVYLPHFRRIVDEGVAVVMSAYNSLNGAWCGQSEALLTEILREEWGFQGFVISDWIFGMRDAAQSVRAGLNVEMPYLMIRHAHLDDELEQGSISFEDVDRAILPTLATMLRFQAILEASAQERSILGCEEHRALAREVATRSMVLLRNEPVDGRPLLPLDGRELSSVALLGGLANAVNLGDGGSSDVWADDVVTVAAALRDALGSDRVAVGSGDDLDEAARLAAAADVAIVVVGCTALDEGEYLGQEGMSHLVELFPGPDASPVEAERFATFVESCPPVEVPERIAERNATGFTPGGDRSSLRLREEDVALIRATVAANPRTVVLLQGGSAFIISDWDQQVPGIVHTFYAGQEGGRAIVDLLLGEAAFEGRLPFSIPTDESHLPAWDPWATEVTYDRWHGWWRLENEGHAAAYPFGFGLGYTEVELSAGSISLEDDELVVILEATNEGARPGRPLCLVFAQRDGAEAPRLIGFARADVAPGSSTSIEVRVPVAELAERDLDRHEMVVRPGTYSISVGPHAEAVTFSAEVELSAEAAASASR